MFDVMITGGEILDGTGAPAYRADLGHPARSHRRHLP